MLHKRSKVQHLFEIEIYCIIINIIIIIIYYFYYYYQISASLLNKINLFQKKKYKKWLYITVNICCFCFQGRVCDFLFVMSQMELNVI